MRRILEAVWAGIVFAIAFFPVALFTAAGWGAAEKTCDASCQTNIALAIWIIGLCARGAVPPAESASTWRRVAVWAIAFAFGWIAYIATSGITAGLASSGVLLTFWPLVYAPGIVAISITSLAGYGFGRSDVALRAAVKVFGTIASLFLALFVGNLPVEQRLVSDVHGTILGSLLFAPTAALIWGGVRFRAAVGARIADLRSIDARLWPFYVAAILISVAALRYIVTG